MPWAIANADNALKMRVLQFNKHAFRLRCDLKTRTEQS